MDSAFWAVIIGAVFLGLQNLLQMWLSYKRDSQIKADVSQNTELTKEGTQAATANAKNAAREASDAKVAAVQATEKITHGLNGDLDKRIGRVVEEKMSLLAGAVAHNAEQSEKNMDEIRGQLHRHAQANAENIGALKMAIEELKERGGHK